MGKIIRNFRSGKLIFLVFIAFWGLGGCSSNVYLEDSATTNSVFYGYIDMEDSDADYLTKVVFEQVSPKPKTKKDRYIFSFYNEDSFYFDKVVPNAVYEWVRFTAMEISRWGNNITYTTHEFRIPKEDRPKFKSGGVGELRYLGSFKFIPKEKGYDLKPLKGKNYEIDVLDAMLDHAVYTNWEPIIEKRIAELE